MKFSIAIIATIATTALAENLRLQHWNLRFDSKRDKASVDSTIASLESSSFPNESGYKYYTDTSEESWSKRRVGIVNDVIFNKAEVFAVNEGLQNQVEDILYLLHYLGDGNTWDYIGVGRDDGKTSGEYEAIFFNTNNIQIEDWTTIWLSQTPFTPSSYPGAGSYRSATIGHFKKNGKPFTLINTHLDDKSDDQRKYGASILKQVGAYEFEKGNGPVFVTADFNSMADGDTSAAYDIAIGKQDPVPISDAFKEKYNVSNTNSFKFNDLVKEVEKKNRLGNLATFKGFVSYSDLPSKLEGRIDFILGGDNSGNTTYSIQRFKTGENLYDDSCWLSDHRPSIADLAF